MVYKPGKKRTGPAMAAVLAFAIFGTFVFSAARITQDIAGGENKPYSASPNGTYTSVNSSVDWLSVEIKTAGRSGRTSFSPFRNVLQWEFVFSGRFYTDNCLTVFSVQPANHGYFFNKDTIHLNLRI